METNFGALEERFKNLASSGQMLELPAPPRTKASLSTFNYYMFGASGEVVSLVVVTRTQSVSQATPLTTRELVVILRARDNDPADLISEARLPFSLDWQMLSNL